MTKRSSCSVKGQGGAAAEAVKQPEAAASKARRYLPTAAGVRETIESVVIAFVLAFLFRTFEAEAFVIPTGSMAPTLMGRHKDTACPDCGNRYQVSASSEVDQDGRPRYDAMGRSVEVGAGTCPMCRYTDTMLADKTSYNGDRILVQKYIYDLREPKRWDVVVFKYPGDPIDLGRDPSGFRATDARTNFIKRLVGLPGETVRIQNGDVWIRQEGAGRFEIARKSPKKVLATLQPVFDNDRMPQIADDGWPIRWRAEAIRDGGKGAWIPENNVVFHIDGTAGDERWLRYHHLVPSYRDWQRAETAQDASSPRLSPQLITDFTAYDTFRERHNAPEPNADGLGQHWVGDLALRCTAEVQSSTGELIFELRKGGQMFQCRIDVATGQATFAAAGDNAPEFRPTATTSVVGAGLYEIMFANVDSQLLLWVNGRVANFDSSTTYEPFSDGRADASDLTPVGVGSKAVAAQISHLRIFRDIFYGAVRGEGSVAEDNDVQYVPGNATPGDYHIASGRGYVEFPLAADQFFVLGDNSPESKDSRLWDANNYWVPRDLLIGKALFLYWPHSWDKIPYTNIPLPYFPNFARMKFVR